MFLTYRRYRINIYYRLSEFRLLYGRYSLRGDARRRARQKSLYLRNSHVVTSRENDSVRSAVSLNLIYHGTLCRRHILLRTRRFRDRTSSPTSSLYTSGKFLALISRSSV